MGDARASDFRKFIPKWMIHDLLFVTTGRKFYVFLLPTPVLQFFDISVKRRRMTFHLIIFIFVRILPFIRLHNTTP